MEVSSELELTETYRYISEDQLDKFDNQILVIIRQLAKLRNTMLTSES